MDDAEIGQIVKYGTEVVQDAAVQEFVGAVVGSPAQEAGAWLADSVRYRRFKSQIKILTKAQRDLAAAGIDPKTVDLTVLVPLLESGSLTDDESMQDRWAALLANAASGGDEVSPAYPSILAFCRSSPREMHSC